MPSGQVLLEENGAHDTQDSIKNTAQRLTVCEECPSSFLKWPRSLQDAGGPRGEKEHRPGTVKEGPGLGGTRGRELSDRRLGPGGGRRC